MQTDKTTINTHSPQSRFKLLASVAFGLVILNGLLFFNLRRSQEQLVNSNELRLEIDNLSINIANLQVDRLTHTVNKTGQPQIQTPKSESLPLLAHDFQLNIRRIVALTPDDMRDKVAAKEISTLLDGFAVQSAQSADLKSLSTVKIKLDEMVVNATDASKSAQLNEQHQFQYLLFGSVASIIIFSVLMVFLNQSLVRAKLVDKIMFARLNEDIGEMSKEKQELLQSNNLLTSLAESDHLTGLSNRSGGSSALLRYFDAATRMHSGLSILMIDVDQFKEFNDTFGHQAGDLVLIEISQILKDTLRTDDQAVRYGGEEFMVVLPFCDEQVAIDVAERIRVHVRDTKWQKRPVTVSIGASTIDNSTTSAEQLVGEADQALYFSKNSGRNRTIHFRSVKMMSKQTQENQIDFQE